MLGLVAKIFLFPITGPVSALKFIGEQVQAELDDELLDETRPLRELLGLGLRRELGEISPEEYDAQESVLLDELDSIRAYKQSLASGGEQEPLVEEDDEDHDDEGGTT